MFSFRLFKAALLIFMLLGSNFAISRAGGSGGRGGGSSGGGGFSGGHFGSYGISRHGGPLTAGEITIAVLAFLALPILLLVYAGVISYLYFFKGKRTKKKIWKRYQLDLFWDHERIVAYAKMFYVEIQEHWTTNSLKNIESKMTRRLFRQQQSILNLYGRRNMMNRVEDIVIERAEIVAFDDYADNSKDRVAVMIEGTMKDYFTYVSKGKKEASSEKFRDVFLFVRRGNELVLDEIVNEPDHNDIATMKNTIE